MKLDVDGYEVAVLRGARDTLRRFAPAIFFEHAPYVVAEKGYNPDEIAEILTAAGYSFADLGGVAWLSAPTNYRTSRRVPASI